MVSKLLRVIQGVLLGIIALFKRAMCFLNRRRRDSTSELPNHNGDSKLEMPTEIITSGSFEPVEFGMHQLPNAPQEMSGHQVCFFLSRKWSAILLTNLSVKANLRWKTCEFKLIRFHLIICCELSRYAHQLVLQQEEDDVFTDWDAWGTGSKPQPPMHLSSQGSIPEGDEPEPDYFSDLGLAPTIQKQKKVGFNIVNYNGVTFKTTMVCIVGSSEV